MLCEEWHEPATEHDAHVRCLDLNQHKCLEVWWRSKLRPKFGDCRTLPLIVTVFNVGGYQLSRATAFQQDRLVRAGRCFVKPNLVKRADCQSKLGRLCHNELAQAGRRRPDDDQEL